MTKAAKIDSAIRRMNSLFSRGIQGGGNGKKHVWKPKLSGSSRHDQGKPMDIDAVNYSHNAPDKGERRNDDCCNCGKPGHFAKDCKLPRKEGKQPQKPKGKQPQAQRKKFTPTRMQQHIRSLIEENFKEGTDDYEEFI
jgi:hypothetical protein